MSEQTNLQAGTQVCIKCETSMPAGGIYCLGCGYEFSTGDEAIGPFSFTFPAVESAYIPSGIGTSKGTLLMFTYGLGAAIAFGPLIYVTHLLAAEIAALFVRMGICLAGLLGMLIYFLGYLLAAPVAGALVGMAIGAGAIRGKSRNSGAAKQIGLICGVFCFGAFATIYFSVLGVDEGLDSGIDYLKLGWNLVTIPLATYFTADSSIKDTPFCEECQKFMKKIELKNRLIRHEKSLVAILDAGEFNKISDFLPDTETKNFCTITVWSCNCEKGWGFVHMYTTQKRISKDNSGNKSENTQTRLVFSKKFAKSQLDKLSSN